MLADPDLLGAAFLARCRELAAEARESGELRPENFDAYDVAVLLGIPAAAFLETVAPMNPMSSGIIRTPAAANTRSFAAACGLLEELVLIQQQSAPCSISDLRCVRSILLCPEEGATGDAPPIARQLAGALRHLAVRVSQRSDYKLNYDALVVRPFQSPGVAAAHAHSPSKYVRRGEGPNGPVLVDFRFRGRPEDRVSCALISFAVRAFAVILGIWIVAALGVVAGAVGGWQWVSQLLASRAPSGPAAGACGPLRGAPSVNFVRSAAPRYRLAFQ
eukprot:tig00020557_g11111.t1